MIDPETIQDFDDCDGESVSCYGFDTETGQWGWGWVPLEDLEEAGREDILDALFPARRHDAA
ncbi:hypothetical protein LGR54_22845 [Ancylobacter sp. Lp-2]|uniref:hypothetical protein n=1 Tax=Ancylobacter sp. Lp-2 TaxID=2881339 RepID=UPI001E398EC4|nr:hypothetical protein [Ancylobacter sp. Lp-2]MCB4771451.1 hypothetical protein [Ancylobacter sp. Lp-2]